MTHELSDDHTYGSDSSQDIGANFNNEWFAMLNNAQKFFDPSLPPLNILDESFNPEVSQGALHNTASDILENNSAVTSGYQNLLNSINFPKQETLQPQITNCEVVDMSYDQQPVEQQLVDSSNPPYVPSSLPASQNWPGNYDFNISFTPPVKKSKGVSWTFSNSADKLYVAKDVTCPINFSTNSAMPDGVKIRTMALYSSPESASEVVERCLDHSRQDVSKNILGAEHFVRCESPMALYEIDPLTKRHSVVVPFENPPVGQIFSTYLYKFTCFGSCPGLNRRPLMLVFSLEHGAEVLGRRKLDVKICACPARDSRADEQQLSQHDTSKKRKKKQAVPLLETLGVSGTSSTSAKKAKITTNGEGCYQLNVKDYKCFEFLKNMKHFYEIINTIKNMPPDVRQVLDEYQKRKGYNVDFGP